MIDVTTWIGISGAGLILVAFIMNQTKMWNDDSVWYDVINLIGAVLLIAYSWLLGSYPFLVLNLVWAGVSLRDVISSQNRLGFLKK